MLHICVIHNILYLDTASLPEPSRDPQASPNKQRVGGTQGIRRVWQGVDVTQGISRVWQGVGEPQGTRSVWQRVGGT